ncbi:protein croquemort-like isoform X1 [Maniola hyperantus]|uniref:protein croquemort-like isoform X1 n=1 Tax=Aphantopus hyperantus TaxID=2795564 RepID=UPI0015693D12|nr:protein croquemort-like [Maniola hyperantus]
MVVSKKSVWLITCGLAFIAGGVLLSATWPRIFHAKIQQMMILKNGSTSFDIWKALPIPIYMECFLFNITNVDDILARKDVQVEVKEMGPYVFREINRKVNITWNDNSTVTFRNQRFWYFQPEMSSGSLSDNITTINPIIATIAYTLRNDRIMLKIFVDMVLRMYHTNMFVTANASSWLFDGVQDPVLDLVGKMPALPYTIPFDRFGWFYKRNGSIDADGLFNINTGGSDFSKLGKMERWQNSNRSIYRKQCGHVQGSAGELWHLETDQQEISIFAADLCTHMTLPYSGPVVKHGIEGVEFTANDSLFDNGHKYPNQACYCDKSQGNDCMPAGAFNVSACKYGAPAFVTLPHMLGMGPYYPSKIKGLRPVERHRFRMSIEPVTGMPLAISAQLQANALVRHIPGISLNNQLPDPDTLLPMFWFREDIEVEGEYVDFAKAALGVRYGLPYGLYAFVIIGLALIVSGVYKIRRFSIMPLKQTDIDASKKFLGTQAR